MNYIEKILNERNSNYHREKATYAWALSLQALQEPINDYSIEGFYRSTKKNKKLNEDDKNYIFKEMIIALEFFHALKELNSSTSTNNIRCISIVAWYYAIYHAATAMVKAQKGKLNNNHKGLANEFDTVIVMQKHIMFPFNLRVSLIEKESRAELKKYADELKCNSKSDNKIPTCPKQYQEWLLAYLNGTCDKIREEIEKGIIEKENVKNFYSKKAKEKRDEKFKTKHISFLHEAYRYRGKANYEDELYLAMHNKGIYVPVNKYIQSLCDVASKFIRIAAFFCMHKIGKEEWKKTITDIKNENILIPDLNILDIH